MTNAQARSFTICPSCTYKALTSTFNPATGLCKICDAKRLAKVVKAPLELEGLHDSQDVAADYGFDNDMNFDRETGEWYTTDDEGNRQVVEVQTTYEDLSIMKRKTQRTEKAADAFLAKAEARIAANMAAFAEWAAWYCRLKETQDVNQMLANKTREANYIELRDVKETYALATSTQQATLVRLGWDKDEVRNMRLTIAEASRLLQRGPKWIWCK